MTPATLHTLAAPAAVRPAAQRVTPDELGVPALAVRVYAMALARVRQTLRAVMSREAYDRLIQGASLSHCERYAPAFPRVCAQVVAIANAGAVEAECRAFPRALDALIDNLYPSAVRRSLDVLDVEEQRHDGEEDNAQTVRRIAPTAATLRAELDCVRRLNAVNNERERVLAAELRRAELSEGHALPSAPAPRVTVVVGGLR